MATPLSASLPLVAYVEAYCRQARVLWVGDARSALPQALLERGARLIYVCDRDATRRREAQARSSERAITFGALDDGPAALREGFFDLVLVENLAAEPDAKDVISHVARLLAPRGVALIAAPNPEAKRPLLASSTSQRPLDYYALYDAVISTLPEVRMLGQVPFVGYAVVDFSAEGDPNPVLDSSLAPPRGEEPDYFVALAGRERRVLEEYAVIQLCAADVLKANAEKAEAAAPAQIAAPAPAPPLAPVPAPAPQRANGPELAALQQKLAKQEAWITELEARAATADERADTAESELDEVCERFGNQEQAHAQERTALVRERDALKSELEQTRRRLSELDERITAKDAELSKVEAEAGTVKSKAAKLEAESSALRAESSVLKAEAQGLRAETAALKAETASLKTETASLKAEAASLKTEAIALKTETEASPDLDRLEAQLKERGERVLGLERDLLESERTGRELLRKLRDSVAPDNAQALAERLALAEAELVTLRWSLELAKGGVASLGNGAKRLS
jgi:SAM-dependent methyltransferase/predicted  nucleic acid-binding Zn-ribbon protein